MTPEEFQAELARIGGTNPFGQPVLKLVDGRTEEKWEAGGWVLKYPVVTSRRQGFEYRDDEGRLQFVEDPKDVPPGKLCVDAYRQEERGEEVMIVERWRSAEFLARTGRFRDRRDEDGSELLPELPSEGHYDFFVRLQRPDGTPHPADREALEMVEALWKYEHSTTLSERNRHAREAFEAEGRERAAKVRGQWNDLWGFDPDDYRQVVTSAGRTKFEKKARHV